MKINKTNLIDKLAIIIKVNEMSGNDNNLIWKMAHEFNINLEVGNAVKNNETL